MYVSCLVSQIFVLFLILIVDLIEETAEVDCEHGNVKNTQSTSMTIVLCYILCNVFSIHISLKKNSFFSLIENGKI